MAGAVIDQGSQDREIIVTETSDTILPLVVDLDESLVKASLLGESLVVLLKENPLLLFVLPVWLLKGREFFARQVFRHSSLDPALLPYRTEVLDYLKTERARGRKIILSASDAKLAEQVSDHFRLFDQILASDRSDAYSRRRQGGHLACSLSENGFDYVAGGSPDTTLLFLARKIVLVNPHSRKASLAARDPQIEKVIEDPQASLRDYLRPLRPQHWIKNLLVFVPVFAAHRFREITLLERSSIAFVALCCYASSGYVLNDLLDLAADRKHPHKRLRAFAAGDLPLSYGLMLVPSLMVLGCALGMAISLQLAGMLLAYLVISVTYSLYIKSVTLLDVIVLAGLYTLRIACGSAAVAIWPSNWLLTFSWFFFLSLALLKRYSELVIMQRISGDGARARGYEIGDAELLASKGTASGYVAVFVLALYISSGPAASLYGRHELMWFLCPLLLYWIGHAWLVAHRGKMNDDPVVFATTDLTSRILILLMLVVTVLAL